MRVLVLLLAGCDEPDPQAVVDCALLSSQTAVEDCRYRLTEPLLSDPVALQGALDQIADPISHDLLLQRLSVNHPAQASTLCRRMKTRQGQEKCRQVTGRPHLSTRPR